MMKTREQAMADNAERTTDFIRAIRHAMIDRDIRNPNHLYSLMKYRGPEGSSPSRGTIHGYFNGTIKPQPWFVQAFEKVCLERDKPLSDEERARIYATFISSY